MKILHIIGFFQPELGYEEYYLAKQQALDGHEVYVLTSDRIWPFAHLKKEERKRQSGTFSLEGFTIIRGKSFFEFRDYILFRDVISQLRTLRPDIIHIHEPRQGIYGLLAMLFAPKSAKIAVDVHEYQLSPGFLNRLEYRVLRASTIKFCVKKADAVFAMTPQTKDFLSKMFKFDKSILVPLGADQSLFYYSESERKAVRKHLKISDSDFLFVFSGKITPSKGIEIILDQIAKLLLKYPRVKLLLVGSGKEDYLANIKDCVRELNLTDKVFFHQGVKPSELYRFFSAADLGYWPISPTISILEALACGLPVLAGNSEIVGHIINDSVGAVISSGNSEVLIEQAMIKWNTDLCDRFGIRDYFLEKFSYEAIAYKVETIYKQM